MQYLLTPYAEPLEPFVWLENTFNEQELDWLQDHAKKANQNGQLGGGAVNSNIRRSQISWMENNKDSNWIYHKLAHAVSSINSKFYRFDLTGFGESLQFTNYDQSEHGMYRWHQDFGTLQTSNRKLSVVVQLTDPSEYEGGNLQLMTNGQPMNVRKERGLLVAFPSWQVHQVTPVTQGSRQSLVMWISGPAFK